MSIELGADLESRVREAAARQGQDVEGFVRSALLRQLDALEAGRWKEREDSLRREFEGAMRDPSFVADIEETMRDFEHVDADACRMLPDA